MYFYVSTPPSYLPTIYSIILPPIHPTLHASIHPSVNPPQLLFIYQFLYRKKKKTRKLLFRPTEGGVVGVIDLMSQQRRYNKHCVSSVCHLKKLCSELLGSRKSMSRQCCDRKRTQRAEKNPMFCTAFCKAETLHSEANLCSECEQLHAVVQGLETLRLTGIIFKDSNCFAQ
jgi:hypothetical protein